jgi:ABC-2 type transport system permease protein
VRKILALVRADGLTVFSYRFQTIVSLGGLFVSIVPLYFVAGALQPVMTKAIANEGQQYFGFVVVGTIAFLLISTAVGALPEAIRSGIGRGTFEAMLATPTPLPVLLTGIIGFPVLWTIVRGGILLASAWMLGAHVAWDRALPAVGILLLLVVAHVPFALLTAALILAFKSAGPLSQGVLTISALLGGVYYPTHVIPSWLHEASAVLPLTYGLRALRRTLLDGASLASVASDVTTLAVLGLVLFSAGILVFAWALHYARRAGTLAQY